MNGLAAIACILFVIAVCLLAWGLTYTRESGKTYKPTMPESRVGDEP